MIKKYSQTYLKTLNNRLNTIFNYSEKYLKVTKNPCKLCGSIRKKNSTTIQFWTNEEYKRFVKGIEDKPLTKIMSINKTYARLKGKDLI
ncbi:MAG: hypothetical protein RR795_08885 [Cetobacterium sp.]|uniref:hypothetical protein n=1 Tax=Cetobacterium sp. TaxID=2071632 RepID=UPI002FCBAB75